MHRMVEVMDRIRELEADLEREVAAAQQRWHYRVEAEPHSRYRFFVDYGDAEGYKRQLPVLRHALTDERKP